MAVPWLQIEDNKIQQRSSLFPYPGRLVLKIGPSLNKEATQTVWVDRPTKSVFVADCRELAAQWTRSENPVSNVALRLCGRVLAPLCSAIIILADGPGGPQSAAKAVAGIFACDPFPQAPSSPRLLVMCRKADKSLFRRCLIIELLHILRRLHPESPRSFWDVQHSLKVTLDSMQVVWNEHTTSIVREVERVSWLQRSTGLGSSHRLLGQLLISGEELGLPSSIILDLYLALASNVAENSRNALQHFLTKGFSSGKAGSRPEIELNTTVFRTLVKRLAPNPKPELTSHTPRCDICLRGSPVHRLSCRHRCCNVCAREHASTALNTRIDLCPRCGAINEEEPSILPPTATLRALVLTGGETWMRHFLYKLRYLLFGHLEDYFDIVSGSGRSAELIQAYFHHHLELKEYGRLLRSVSKLWRHRQLPVPDSRICTLLHGSCGKKEDGSWISRRLCKHEDADIIRWTEVESSTMWGSRPGLLVYTHLPVKQVANQLFASLFYVAVMDSPDFSTMPKMCDIEIRCRLRCGEHLYRIIRLMRTENLQLHCNCNTAKTSIDLAGSNWDLISSGKFQGFRRRLNVKVNSLLSEIHVWVDSPIGQGSRQGISGSPYRLMDLLDLGL